MIEPEELCNWNRHQHPGCVGVQAKRFDLVGGHPKSKIIIVDRIRQCRYLTRIQPVQFVLGGKNGLKLQVEQIKAMIFKTQLFEHRSPFIILRGWVLYCRLDR